MNTESLTTRRVIFGEMKQPGDYCFGDDRAVIYVWLPGTRGPDALRIQRGKAGGDRVWGWDGNEEAPTLTPSISAPGRWHGYLTAGKLVSC